MKKYIIFSSARSGSTSLIAALNYNFNNVHEPLMSRSGDVKHNKKFIKLLRSLDFIPELDTYEDGKPPRAKFKKPPNNPFPNNQFNFICEDQNHLQEYMKALYVEFDGLKHVFNTVSAICNENVLNFCIDNKIKILFLTRRSHMRGVLSGMVSQQARIFQLGSDLEYKEEYESFPFSAIDIELLKRRSAHLEERMGVYRDKIRESGCEHSEIYYEDIFTNKDEAFRRSQVGDILDFIGLPLCSDVELNLNKYIFNSERKQNNNSVLSKIPNVLDIKKLLNE